MIHAWNWPVILGLHDIPVLPAAAFLVQETQNDSLKTASRGDLMFLLIEVTVQLGPKRALVLLKFFYVLPIYRSQERLSPCEQPFWPVEVLKNPEHPSGCATGKRITKPEGHAHNCTPVKHHFEEKHFWFEFSFYN